MITKATIKRPDGSTSFSDEHLLLDDYAVAKLLREVGVKAVVLEMKDGSSMTYEEIS